MNRHELRLLLITTFAAFCALYAPQPILPRLAEEFAISNSDASLLISATLLPLGLAPILYGYLIEAVPARLLLTGALLALAIGQLLFAIAEDYWLLLVARLIQGLSFPAIFTAVTTYCSSSATPDSVRRVMALYVAVTICGGYAGRLISGLIADLADWRLTFYILTATFILCALWITRLPGKTRIDFTRLDKKAIVSVWQEAKYRNGLLVIFFIFFVFAALLNAMPFRLREIDPGISDFMISMVYGGYLFGAMIAVFSSRISAKLGGDIRSIMIGIVLFSAATLAFAIPGTTFALVNMFAFVIGMFLVHSILSGYLNQLATKRKGIVNGLYISFYYAGGAIGSWLPSLIYSELGWNALIFILLIFCAAGLYFTYRLEKCSS